ncbi:benzoate 4-monooxygenase cytochrome P450 [Aspergillus piperis CBS 112811]|uniref:Benzoate 4-monooxygenase cytochrome P450 n=1 Tax=Aspergillus piperis CBS 112811 TaxID=1448313 RepID=A0A8G1RDM6_9EURO|nr:benzoate 4-monooxygenase cytochrome P450 [Aspergillus piperis CBS 112811]RAH61360.1 benzoate 4-monooxygenase cytochrome P450 [Aspergillus piperis CBS 112811]
MDLVLTSPGWAPLVVGVAAAMMGIVAYRLWLDPLARFPGPRLWAISRLPRIYHTSRGRMWRQLESLHQQYGPIVRIAPGELSFCSAPAWSDIYTSRPTMPKDGATLTPPINGAHSLFTALGDDHRRLRGALVAGFSDKALRDLAPGIEHHVTEFIARLRRELEQGNPVIDLQKFFGYATLDTITDLGYSEPMHALADRNEHDWIARLSLHSRFGTMLSCLYWLYPLNRLTNIVVLSLSQSQRAKNWAVFGSKIEARVARGNQPGQKADLIAPIMSKVTDQEVPSKDSKSGNKNMITRKEVMSHTLSTVMANGLITTVTLTSCTYFLLRHADALQHAVKEVRDTFTCDGQITVQSTQGMAYLEAVINETMRLHHPTPITLARVVPPEGRRIDGHFIRGNATVEPFAFHPERFLPRDDVRYNSRFDKDVKEVYLPFAAGPRHCIGEKFFLAEARVTLARLLWNFDMVLADPQAENWLDQRAFTVFEQKPLLH